jgi:hypothetical protein
MTVCRLGQRPPDCPGTISHGIAWVVLIVIALGLQTVNPQARTPPSAQVKANDAADVVLQEAQKP